MRWEPAAAAGCRDRSHKMGNWIINHGLSSFILVSCWSSDLGELTCKIMAGARIYTRKRHLKSNRDYLPVLTDLWRGRFTGGLDGHQHFPLRLVLSLLRFRGKLLLHASHLGGKWRRQTRLAEVTKSVFHKKISTRCILPSSPSLPWLGPGLQPPSSTLTVCWSSCRSAETCCRSSEARLWWDYDAFRARAHETFQLCLLISSDM